MSSWLGSICNSSASIQTAPGHIQAIAAVIWHAKETDSESTVSQHFSEELFRCVPVRFCSDEKHTTCSIVFKTFSLCNTTKNLYYVTNDKEIYLRYLNPFAIVSVMILPYSNC